MRLLVTRPQPEGDRTAARLRSRGHAVLVAPLLSFEEISVPIAGRDWGGVLITSANAVRSFDASTLPAGLKSLPLVAVGESSAEAARAAGFEHVDSAAGDAQTLAVRAAAAFRNEPRPLLYLAGEQRAHDLAAILGSTGIEVETLVTYRMAAVGELAPTLVAAFQGGTVDGVLHFSRRTAEIFLSLATAAEISEAALQATQYCMSSAIAAPLRAAGANRINVACAPNETALLALIES